MTAAGAFKVTARETSVPNVYDIYVANVKTTTVTSEKRTVAEVEAFMQLEEILFRYSDPEHETLTEEAEVVKKVNDFLYDLAQAVGIGRD